jgi:hypothetical protein
MTRDKVITSLSSELATLIKQGADIDTACKLYIQMALVVGTDHFYFDQEEVIAYDRLGNEVGRYKSTNDASEKLCVNRRDLHRVIEGKRHSCGGYIFKKVEDKTPVYELKSA